MSEPHPPAPTDPARAHEEVEDLRRLLDVVRRINAEVRADAVLEAIVDSVVSITRADRGFLMVREPDGSLRFAIARDRHGGPLEEQRFQVSRGVVDEVARTGETRLIDDASSATAWHARRSIVSLSLRTIVCTPLTTRQGVEGVIYVDSSSISRRFTDRDVPLVEAFAAQAAAALERVRLQEAERDRDRMRSQLEIASEIQRTFLPSTFPALAGVDGAVASVPAQQVGGDFYDVLRLRGGRVGLLVGDVAGKGVPGALFGARLLSDLRYEALLRDDVGAVLGALNGIVGERATRGMFVTLLYAVLDPATGVVEFGNAGHPPPLVRRADGDIDRWRSPSGLPLGVLPDARWPVGHGVLEPGDVLVAITDGIPDAAGAAGERFEMERVLETLRRGPPEPAALVRSLCAATAAFTGNLPQADDQTLLAVRRA